MRYVYKFLALLLIAGLAFVAAATVSWPSSISGQSTADAAAVPCSSLPRLWSGSTDVSYDRLTDTVKFVWSPHAVTAEEAARIPQDATERVEATIAVGDARCGSQPGLEEFVNGMKQADLQSRQNGCDQTGRLIDVLRREYQIAPGPVLTATPLEVTAEMELEAAYPDQPLKQSDSELKAILEHTYGAKGSRTVDLRLLEESLSLDCGPDLGLARERAATRKGS